MAVTHLGLPGWFQSIISIAGILTALPIGLWLEDRIWRQLAGFTPFRRVAYTLAVPFAWVLVFPFAAILGAIPAALGDSGLLAEIAIFCPLIAASAGVGSAIVLVLETVVARLVAGFEARLVALMLGLMAWGTLGTLFCVVASGVVIEAIRTLEPGTLKLSVAGVPLEPDEVTALLDSVTGRFQMIGFLAFATIVPGIPAVISACAKLAGQILQRIEPVVAGFREIASGNLAIEVAEGGPREFRELASHFNRMVGSLALAARVESAFGRYTSPHLIERIKASGIAEIPASQRMASVFFADIRGFTSMSEKLSAPEVVDVLNRYFAVVVPLIDAHDGYLDKFVGDAVIVVFNGPVDQPDHIERAARCALDLQDAVANLNAEGRFADVGGLRIGVGLCAGPLVAGNIGAKAKTEYTVIGDTVNLASRLTSEAQAGEVVVNEAIAVALPADLRAESRPPIRVKGKEQPVLSSLLRRRA